MSSQPSPSRSLPRPDATGSGYESERVDQLDDPVSSSSQQVDDPGHQSCQPLEEMDFEPIGNPDPPHYQVPDWIKGHYRNPNKPIAHCFIDKRLKRVCALYRLAVYSHDSVETKKRAVMSIPWHELDYSGSSLEQKEYHRFCDQGPDSGCQFQKHVSA